MKTRFLLKVRGSAKGATHPIYLALYEGDQTEIIYTGQRIAKAEWHKTERLPKDHEGEIYKEIDKVRKRVDLAKLRLEADEKPVTPFTVKQSYESLVKQKGDDQLNNEKKAKEGLRTIASLAKHWTENYLFEFAPSTQKAVKESLRQFVSLPDEGKHKKGYKPPVPYLKKVGLSQLERQDLNEEVIKGYEKYLQDTLKLADSTHGKRIKHLRWFLKYLKMDVKDFKIRTGVTNKILLDLKELRKFQNVDVSYDQQLQRAKDLYLLGCYTAQRVSDLKRINTTNSQNGFITLKTKKSQGLTTVKIPIVSVTKDILERNGYRAPKISESDANKLIKEVAKLAGITSQTEVISKGGGLGVVTKDVAKHDALVMHSSIKTFISTVGPDIYNFTPEEIAALVGKDIKTLYKHYFKLPADKARLKMISVDNSLMKIA